MLIKTFQITLLNKDALGFYSDAVKLCPTNPIAVIGLVKYKSFIITATQDTILFLKLKYRIDTIIEMKTYNERI